jgi:hemolysin III
MEPGRNNAEPGPLKLQDPLHPGFRREEAANAATHALALAACLAGAALLLTRAALRQANPWQIAGLAVYAATLVTAYLASTLSHVCRHPRRRHAWRIADQAVIFLFIAGSYTPMALTWLRHGPWWLLHGVIWGVGLAGFVSKAAFAHRVRLGSVSAALYLFLGWMPLFATWPLLRAVPQGFLVWLLAGGLCYSAGILFFRFDHRIPYFHAAWHLSVIGGSLCHYLGVLLFCTVPPA